MSRHLDPSRLDAAQSHIYRAMQELTAVQELDFSAVEKVIQALSDVHRNVDTLRFPKE